MNRFIKILFLFLIFVLPVLIFLFLKFYGRNEFAIPVFYEKGLSSDTLGCRYEEGPYFVDLNQLNEKQDHLIMLDGKPGSLKESRLQNVVTRIKSDPHFVHIIVFSGRLQNELDDFSDLDVFELTQADLQVLKCTLVTDQDEQIILVDKNRQIRGYYGTDREEIDRLLVELEIMENHE